MGGIDLEALCKWIDDYAEKLKGLPDAKFDEFCNKMEVLINLQDFIIERMKGETTCGHIW